MTQTILLADDSVTIQKVVELTFMDGDYHVVAVGNGADGASRLADVRPDVVIADVHMPGLNGFDLCRRVKEWRPETPVLLLVGTFEPFDREQFTASGADGHLKKPFDSQELQKQVDNLLRRSAPARPAAAMPAPSAEPDWMSGTSDSEPPPLPEESWNANSAAWQETPQATSDWSEPAPEASWRPQEAALDWTDSEVPAAPEPDSAPAAPAPWLGNQTAKISDEVLRSVSASVQPPPPTPQPAPAPAQSAAAPADRELSDEEVDRIARRVAAILGEQIVRDVSWEVIPDLAEVIIKDRIRELEAQVE